MIITGTLMAIGAGVALPGHMLMFGRVINQFVYYSIAAGNLTGLAAAAVNLTGSCDTATLRTIRANGSMGAGMMRNASVVQGCFGDTSQQQSSSVFDEALVYVCDPGGTLQYEIGLFSLYYVALATGVLIASFLATVLWNVSAYRQTRRMRVAFYCAILRQEVGWFDVNEAAELSTRLAE